MKVEKWFYKMFNTPKVKYSCFIQSDSGDNICKMLRDDAPNNEIQEERAKLICAAPQMLESLQSILSWSAHFPQAMNDEILKAKEIIKKASK